ncbi:DUF2694 domain-containing protein [Mycobacterium camsae]|uniref:DUF2694 domain-containing protein n=1 Tax=Mycobacterium gordonae TaxID=1778 RepID=UPI001981266A|nr:DUF2694 domain-containing protein [Mycobacterium gordonae]
MRQCLPGGDDDHEDLGALNFSHADREDDEGLTADALRAYALTEPEDCETDLAAIRFDSDQDQNSDDEDPVALFTVANPRETVCVSAGLDGRIHQVDLAPEATSMNESELADEILVLAVLARHKGLAGQHAYLSDEDSLPEALCELESLDGCKVLHELIATGVAAWTPEQAAVAQDELFAVRYQRNK